MILALIFFAVAALGGLTLAYLRLSNKELPTPLALLHGALAAVGIVLLLIAVIGTGGGGGPLAALILFAIAALGGFLLFSFHMRKKQLPIGVMTVHGLVAVIAFVVLLVAVTRGA